MESATPAVLSLEKVYLEAYEDYQNKNAWYEFKVLGMFLLFVIPFFGLSTIWYLRAKRKDSPYAIIATSVMSAAAILFLQVVLRFLYDVFPMKWIERIIDIFMTVPLLRFFIYYGSIALVIAIFGGIVYIIQKRVFNPKRVSLRRIKQGECPRCSYKFHRDDRHCPICSLQLKTKCSACENERLAHTSYCSTCGGKGRKRVK